MPKSRWPLPRASAGTCSKGNASNRPRLVATATCEAVSPTTTGGSATAPAVTFNTALPARLFESVSAKVVAKP